MTDYMNLSIEEIDKKIAENDKVLKKYWEMETGSWEEYRDLCQPYWDDNSDLNAAKTLKTPREEIELRPFSELDKECRMDIKDFTECCKEGFLTSWDGVGYYATEDSVSWLVASTYAFKHGMIRPDFDYVCWYNK